MLYRDFFPEDFDCLETELQEAHEEEHPHPGHSVLPLQIFEIIRNILNPMYNTHIPNMIYTAISCIKIYLEISNS